MPFREYAKIIYLLILKFMNDKYFIIKSNFIFRICHHLSFFVFLVNMWISLHRVVPVYKHPCVQSIFFECVYFVFRKTTEIWWKSKLILKNARVNEVDWIWGLPLLILIVQLYGERSANFSMNS